MKIFGNKIIWSISAMVVTLLNVSAQDYVELTFSDSFKSGGGFKSSIPYLPKAQRMNKSASRIIVGYEEGMSEEIIKCMEYVASVWESYIQNCIDIHVNVEFSSIEEDMQTVVRYAQKDGLIYPLALKAYIEKDNDRDHTYPDGLIILNINTQWDYNMGDNITSNKQNLAYALMRGMARIMGFGASVNTNEEADYWFTDKRYHSLFNTLVSNSKGELLSSLSINKGRPSAELKAYIEESGQVFNVNASGCEYSLASSPFSVSNPPFAYLDDRYTNSLMTTGLYSGNYILQVDDITRDILNTMGWNTLPPAVISIVSDDISDNGIGSAYNSHIFRISGRNVTVTNPEWRLALPLKNGNVETISLQDTGLTCTVPAITDETKYAVTIDGDIDAILYFSGKVNGSEKSADPFRLHLELKPVIERVSINSIDSNYPLDSYNVAYTVYYRGAEKIKVSVEEEYSSKLKVKYVNEPYIAEGVAENVTSPYYAWIDFLVENQYGNAMHTIELGPNGEVLGTSLNQNTQSAVQRRPLAGTELPISQYEETLEVYDVLGNHLATCSEPSEVQHVPYPGMVIILKKINGKVTEVIKRINP